jgi:NAD(P)-dependent dehydrogenase (short-subunit alcohol dehydrogenase family)
MADHPPPPAPWHLTIFNWLSSQFTTLPYPTRSWAGKTVVVTGANSAMGLEAARHFARLGADLVVLGVRSVERGEAARADILRTTGRPQESVQAWEVDLASHASVRAFAARAREELAGRGGGGLDVVVGNAGVLLHEYATAPDGGGDEMTIAVNVVGTLLLGVLLLPLLRETSVRKGGAETVLTTTGSFMHYITAFPERKAERIFEELRVEERARMDDR